MLKALPKTIWFYFNAIWTKPEKETKETNMETRSVQQQKIKPHEVYSQIRRNMY